MERPTRRKKDRRNADDFCQRFGAVAVRKGFVTLDQVKQAMSDQIEDDTNGREHRLLGSILYDHGYITEHQIEQLLIELRQAL